MIILFDIMYNFSIIFFGDFMNINTQLAQLLYDYSNKKKIADILFCEEAIQKK